MTKITQTFSERPEKEREKDMELNLNYHNELVLTKTPVNACTDICICAVPMQYPVRINDDLVYSCNVFENAVELARILHNDMKGKHYE